MSGLGEFHHAEEAETKGTKITHWIIFAVVLAGAEIGHHDVALHPGLAEIYRQKVADLSAALNVPAQRQEAEVAAPGAGRPVACR